MTRQKMKNKKIFTILTRILAVVLLFTALFVSANSGLAAEFPRAQLDESERYYTEAYMRFLNRDYWGASDYLERALKINTYLVDYYLLRALVMQRIGDYSAAREALTYYMEVRPMDSTAPRILSYIIAQQRYVRQLAGSSSVSARWRFTKPDILSEFRMGYLRSFSAAGLGKADSLGATLGISDTLGDKIVFQSYAGGRLKTVRVESPVTAMPMGDGTFYVVTTSGDVYSVLPSNLPSNFLTGLSETRLTSQDIRAKLGDVTVADAAVLSSSEFAVADPVAREVAFYSLADFVRTGTWAPVLNETAMLFEPVAAAVYGPWLAVADRGNEQIIFLNILNRRESFSAPIARPRDVNWSSIGELFVIGEGGELSRLLMDFRSRKVDAIDVMDTNLENAWTLFSAPSGNMYCLDVGAANIWKAEALPDVELSSGFLSLFQPRVERVRLENSESENLLLDAAVSSPFISYSEIAQKVVHAIWNEKTIISRATWNPDGRTDKAPVFLIFQRPAQAGTVTPEIRSVNADGGIDIQINLPSVWMAKDNALTNILIDSSISFEPDELDALTFFCLNNGLELDIWGRTVPTVEMIRSSALTGGKVIWSLANKPDLTPPNSSVRVTIPLPLDLSSSGYPNRSMLTLYLDVGMLHTRNWIPLWPDILE
ncbi:hypothetical protein FACS1894187_04230 [Synergistales bacterium]|nr:hypothetical protein FACS1894187_04230 [Synergistales bacterium]